MAKTLIVNGIHNYTAPEEYIPPKSAAVREHLEWFMDQKLKRRRRRMEPGRYDMG